MEKRKLGISLSREYEIPIGDVIGLLSRVGFAAVSPVWDGDEALGVIAAAAKRNGMVLQSLHAPYANANKLWSRDENESAPAKNEIKETVTACAKYGIPVLVVHAWIGFRYKFEPDLLTYGAFDEMVDCARENGVKIAFENTEGQEFLSLLMDRYVGNDTVGFCWDSGHEMCYNHSEDMLAKYGDRLLVTHLNDNLGISDPGGKIYWTDDLHLLPGDGIADWDAAAQRLKKARRLEILNLELSRNSKPDRHENDRYKEMPLEEYFAEAYRSGRMVAEKAMP